MRIVSAALLLTVVMGLVTIRIESAYLSRYPLFYDPAIYSLENARLYVQLADGYPAALRGQSLVVTPIDR